MISNNFLRYKILSAVYVLLFTVISGTLLAQSSYDLNGTFEGLRKQYNSTHTDFIQDFQYRFDLVQDGDRIEGISTIYSPNGDYAEVNIRGYVVGNKLYFEEYDIIDQMKSSNKVWCYKVGVLEIVSKDGLLWLVGDTESFMSNYGYACTGGHTEISKTDTKPIETSKGEAGMELSINANVFPNPVSSTTTLSFDIDYKDKVKIDVFDISGSHVLNVFNGKVESGTHNKSINMSDLTPGLYIVKLSTSKAVFSEQLIKVEK